MAEELDLFTVGRKKDRKKAPKSPPLPKGTMLHFLGVYKSLYYRRFGQYPMLAPHHPSLLKKLIQQYGSELVERRLRAYVQDTPLDDFIKKAGLTLAIFYTRWASFDAKENPQPQPQDSLCQHTPPCQSVAAHSQRIVAEMRRPPMSPSSPATSRPNDPC